MISSRHVRQEKLAVINHPLHNLVEIEENLKDTLKYIKQKTSREFQISLTTRGKTVKE